MSFSLILARRHPPSRAPSSPLKTRNYHRTGEDSSRFGRGLVAKPYVLRPEGCEARPADEQQCDLNSWKSHCNLSHNIDVGIVAGDTNSLPGASMMKPITGPLACQMPSKP